ncbi:uncharacterized protein [Choristoneura fumiferana]|uniref:uncharacterized protein n=1 Tax=Choristoneura fumiferana TaxID=7141 RepID=UPI003D15C64F
MDCVLQALKRQLQQIGEDDDLEYVEEELSMCSEADRRQRYEALDAAAGALAARQHSVRAWPRLAALQRRLERLAFAAAQPPVLPPPPRTRPRPAAHHRLNTTLRMGKYGIAHQACH